MKKVVFFLKINSGFYIGLILLIFICSSCISYQDVELKEIKSFGFQNNDISSGKIEVLLRVINPNNYNIKIKNYDLHAFVNNEDMGKIDVDENLVLLKKSDQDYKLTLKPNLGKILAILPSLYIAGSADAAIRGNVTAKASIISKTFDVNLQKKLSVSDFQ